MNINFQCGAILIGNSVLKVMKLGLMFKEERISSMVELKM